LTLIPVSSTNHWSPGVRRANLAASASSGVNRCDYTSTVQRCGHTIQPVLHVEREPADAQRWLDITERTGVLLT
jgi:hypothetical protein